MCIVIAKFVEVDPRGALTNSRSSYELAALQQSPGDLSHTTLVECIGIVPCSTVKIAAWMEAGSLPMSVCLTISTPVAP